jgi:hypothetical protein
MIRAVLIALACTLALTFGPIEPRVAHAQLGGFAAKQAQDFERRRACEQNVPTCRPQDRRQLAEERSRNLWLSFMIGGVLVLVGLVIVREGQKKKREEQQRVAKARQAARQREMQKAEARTEGDDFGGVSGLGRSTVDRPPGFGRLD